LRALARRGAPAAAAGTITLRLPARAPFDGAGLFRFFADHAIRGFESGDDSRFARALRLPGGPAEVEIRLEDSPAVHPVLLLEARLAALADLPALTARVRRMFDLDA